MVFRVGHTRGFRGRYERGPHAANRNPFHAPVGILSPGGFGYVNDWGDWNRAFQAYAADDLALAQEFTANLGVGHEGEYIPFVTVLNTEAELAAASEIHRIADDVEVEIAEGQSIDAIREEIIGELKEAQSYLPPANRPLMISLLLPGALLPDVAFSDGLFVGKLEYGKMLIPHEIQEDAARFQRAVGRAWAYHVGVSLSGELCDAWLLEAMTALVDADEKALFPPTALHARDLNVILEGAGKDDSDEMWRRARVQCGNIGRRTLAKEGRLQELLTAHTEKGWADLLSEGKNPATERALRKIWHLSVDDVVG